METYTRRKASASIDASASDISRGIEYDIEVIGRIPLLSLSQISGTGPVTEETDVTADVNYNISISSAAIDAVDPTTVYNALDDKDENGRFRVIAQVSSLVSMNNAYIYYDSKFKDLLLVSDLSSIGTGLDDSCLNGHKFRVKAYLLGGYGGATTAHTEEFVFAVSDSDKRIHMPEPPIVDTKTFMVRLQGQGDNAIQRLGVNFGVYYLESTKLPVVSMCAIGSSENLFNDVCQVYKVIRTSSRYELVYAGRTEVQMLSFVYPW